MAPVKVCPVCSKVNGPSAFSCLGCGVDVSSVEPSEFEEHDRDSGVSGATAAHGTQLECETPTGKVSVIFPWGHELISDRLPVGRDAEFSPLSSRLADNNYVSRRHAELFLRDGYLYVRHVGETNPTYVNGRPLTTGDEQLLADGDEIAFSRHLTARVRVD